MDDRKNCKIKRVRNKTYKEIAPLKDLNLDEKKSLLRKKEKFEAIANYSANWECWFDSKGNPVWMNSLCNRLTGYSPEEYMESRDCLSMIFAVEDRVKFEKVLSGVTNEDNSNEIEFAIFRKDGTKFWAAVTWRTIQDSRGVALGVRTSIQDISRKKIAFQALKDSTIKQQSALTSKDRFLSIIAHDLVSPISAVVELSRYMTDEFSSIPRNDFRQYSESINRSANHTLNLLIELLEWEKAEQGLIEFNPERIPLNNIATEVIAKFNELTLERKLDIVNEIPIDLFVLGDKNMLKTVFRNLISNAIKFTPAGGTIFLATKPHNGEMTQVTVMDTGIGMTEELRQALFHFDLKNQRTGLNKEPSNGLGLLLCKEFISKHGGIIWADSTEKSGSSIHFSIPFHRSAEEPFELTNAPHKVKNEKTVTIQKILIVEDDKISLSLTTKILRKISQEIIHAQTGIEAIEQFRHNSEVDLVLMDIGLPGIGGYEAARQIRRYNRDVIIIAQSAGYPPIELSQAGEMVFNDYVNKPIDYQQLIAIIQKHCIKQK